MTGRSETENAEAVRAELLRLGYLASGVDRYIFGRAPRRGGAAAELLAAALRGAVLLAPLVALALSILLVAANRESMSPLRDGAVLVLHMLPVGWGLSVAAMLLVGGATALFLRRSRRPDPAKAARAVAVPLVLLSAGGAAAVVASAPGLQSVGRIGSLLALALLAAAAFRVAEDELLALLVRLEGIAPASPRGSALRLAAAAVAVVLLVAAASSLAAARRTDPGKAPSLVVGRHPGYRIAIVAVDGFDEASARLFRGEIPAVASILEGDATRLDYVRGSAQPPELWTTIWTGLPAARHGMGAYEWVRPLGMTGTLGHVGPLGFFFRGVLARIDLATIGAATSTERRAAALWEITSRGGYATLQVGNWGSGPAARILGRSVSNRAALRIRSGGGIDSEVEPKTLAARLSGVGTEVGARDDAAEWIDDWQIEVFASLFAERREEIGVLYLPGLDLIRNPRDPKAGEAALLERAERTKRRYLALDRLLSQLRKDDPGIAIVLVADSGRGGSGRGVVRIERLLGARGRAEGGTVDLLPTLLAPLGIPLSSELAGRAAFAPSPPPAVERYEPPDRSAAQPFDAERTLRELRSLGYVN